MLSQKLVSNTGANSLSATGNDNVVDYEDLEASENQPEERWMNPQMYGLQSRFANQYAYNMNQYGPRFAQLAKR